MRKLLQINTVVNSGSTGRIAEDIGQLAIAKGWKSYMSYGRNEMSSRSNLIKIGTDWDIKMHGVQTRLFDNHGFASKNATLKYIQEIERVNPSIIHLHNLHGYYVNIEVLFNYLAKADIPVVWTLHDCWSFTGHCTHFESVGCEKWKTKCYSCPLTKFYPASLFIDNSKNNYTKKKTLFNSVKDMTIVPVSYWLGDLLKESFLKRYPIKVIQNGIDINAFSIKENDDIKLKYNLKDKFIILGVAGVWPPSKGLEDFINLSQRLKEDEIIILVGLSKEQIKTLPINIIGIERTENVEELAKLYSMADVFINPTYEDTFPTTNLEALACGTPVVTYNTGGSPEVIDEKTGFVVEKGSVDGLVKVIAEIKGKGKDYYFDACVNRARERYDKEDRFEEYFELYDSIVTR